MCRYLNALGPADICRRLELNARIEMVRVQGPDVQTLDRSEEAHESPMTMLIIIALILPIIEFQRFLQHLHWCTFHLRIFYWHWS